MYDLADILSAATERAQVNHRAYAGSDTPSRHWRRAQKSEPSRPTNSGSVRHERDVAGWPFPTGRSAAVTALVEAIEEALQPFHPRPHLAKVFGEAHPWSALPAADGFPPAGRGVRPAWHLRTPTSRAPSWPEQPTRIHRCPVPTALCG